MVGIIVLHWNNYPATRRCLDSLLALPPDGSRVYIVDNGSTDGSMDRLEGEFADRGVTFIRNGTNLGFSAGSNRGIRRALDEGCSHILLLNNDCILPDPEAVGHAAALAESDPRCGIVGGKVLFWPETSRIWSVGGSIGPLSETFAGHGEIDHGQYDRVTETGFVSGAFMLLTAGVIERLGLLPEEYFFGYEDREYCLRAHRAGFRLLYQPRAVVHHEAGGSHKALAPLYLYNETLCKILFRRRALSPAAFRLWHLAYSLYVLLVLPIRHRLSPGTYLEGTDAGRLRSVMWSAIRDSRHLRQITRATLDRFQAAQADSGPSSASDR